MQLFSQRSWARFAAALLVVAARGLLAAPNSMAQFADDAYFNEQVLPILEQTCLECHNAEKQKGGLRMDSRTALLRGGDKGVVVTPGAPDSSLLVRAIRREGELKMPPKEELFPKDVEVLTEWVRRGMPWPEGSIPAAPIAPAVETRDVPGVSLAIDPGPPLKFDRDIRPLLADRCYACHGPDSAERKAGLRLDDPAVALSPLASGHQAIAPGSLAKSQLFQRIAATSADDRMPPADFHKSLSADEIQRLGRWILQGAPWEQHWAFVPPARPQPPVASQPSFARNPIDHFVLARLDAEGLVPAEEADRRTLIRRLSYDLSGLPPTVNEVREFLADTRPDAYERLVDRLLATPAYGEHMARYWLDAARYADTNGYHIDNMRFMWRWRDWVIDAFNQNMPFDQFTIEQIAGDLLPNATLDQQIASGFNRNHMINFEGGAIPEEYRTAYVMDRVDTTSTVWMGLTMHCAQCHDHKFDPISRRDYYSMFAYFNSIAEQGLDATKGNAVPLLPAPLPEQAARLSALEQRASGLEERLAPGPEIEEAFAAWVSQASAIAAKSWTPLAPETMKSSGGATLTAQTDFSILVSGTNPEKDTYEIGAQTAARGITAVRLEALLDPSLPQLGPGRFDNANFVLTEFELEIGAADKPEAIERVKFRRAYADHSQPEFDVAKAIDGDAASGWAADADTKRELRSALFLAEKPFGFEPGTRLVFRLRHESPFAGHGMGRVRLSITSEPAFAPIAIGPWFANGPFAGVKAEAVFVQRFAPEKKRSIDTAETYGDGRAVWFNAEPAPRDKPLTLAAGASALYFYREITAPTDRTLTFSIGSRQRLKAWANGEPVLVKSTTTADNAPLQRVSAPLRSGKNALLIKLVSEQGKFGIGFDAIDEVSATMPAALALALSEPAQNRRPRQNEALRAFYLRSQDSDYARAEKQQRWLKFVAADYTKHLPTTMVMGEAPQARSTFMLRRGQYDQPEDEVKPATPAFLPPIPAGTPNNRLGLAQWLVSPENPLTARVTVNRFWQQFFGRGLVLTSEDFGTQGTRPSHPELLDWLATEFVASQWDMKGLVRLIVTSSTYRQSSRPSPAALENDPENLLFARGPRFRLDAEQVRDGALAIGGLLVADVGGESVYPYQPEGLWEAVSFKGGFSAQFYAQGHGPGQLYRRGMYTFWKRTSPPPAMMIFDAPNRETCAVRRGRTNTPLQALVLMNDPQFVEAARAFAQRILREGGATPEERLAFAFEASTARLPAPDEARVLLDLYTSERAAFDAKAESAESLIAVGESEPDPALDAAELAAWTAVASTLLNLDETITKG